MLLFALAAMATAQLPLAPSVVTRTVRCAPALTPAASQGSLDARKLGELPPGYAMLAVNKTVRGCPVAVLLERGADGERKMIPVDPGRVTPAPARERLQPKRRLERD